MESMEATEQIRPVDSTDLVERTVLTPLGKFRLQWPGTACEPTYVGDPLAIAWFHDNFIRMRQVSGRGGVLLDPVRLTPEDLVYCCQTERCGIRVLVERR